MPFASLVSGRNLTALLAAAVIVTLGAGAGLARVMAGGTGPFPGTTLGGFLPDRERSFSDWLEGERRRFGERRVSVSADGFALDVPARALGIEVDVPEMLQVAQRQIRNGSSLTRLHRAVNARLSRLDYAWVTRFDRETARVTLLALAPAVDRAPVDAEVDLVRRRIVRAADGTKLDVDQTLDYLESHRSVELDSLPLVMVPQLPRVSDQDASAVDVTQVLSRFETDFRTKAGTRAVNIRVAARALQGQTILPREIFSFNRAVGPRIETRGYLEAPVIVDDELEPGVGGGVCQVATTLHAAAVLGGLEVVERRSHSRPSGYAPLGLDATVIDGQVDLKLRNPYSVPISITTSFPDKYRIRVELLGLSASDRIDHNYVVTKRRDFYRRVITKPELSPGTFKRKQKGNYGFDVTSVVTRSRAGVAISRSRYGSRYWPVPEVYWIGPNTEIATLPSLPDGATGVQLDGVTVLGAIPVDVEERLGKIDSPADGGEP